MTREEVKKLFPEATDEVVTELLNKTNSEIARERGKAEKIKNELDDLKSSAANAEELQKKIEEMEQEKMTDVEKISQQLEKSNQRVAELEKSIAISNQRTSAAEKFKITAEQAGQVVKDDGSLDFDLLGQIISEKETNAVSEYEKKKLAETQNPGGAGGSRDDGNLAKEIAIASAKRAGTVNESILENYKR